MKLAHNPDEPCGGVRILGMDIKGHRVNRVMVAQGADIAASTTSLLLDRAERTYLAMASRSGGVDIEQLADEHPELLAKVPFDPRVGVDDDKATEIAQAAGFDEGEQPDIAEVLRTLWQVYHEEDATLVEVNPLVRTTDGRIIALDGKITLDDNASYRHPDHAELVDEASEDPLEARAKEKGLHYVKLDGQVGVIGNGAGLVMSTLDVVAYAGENLPGKPHPANFLDIGGGASAQVMADGLEIILSDPQVSVVFVNVFGGITACSEVAKGIREALKQLGHRATRPIVVRLDGNAVEVGREILAEYNHPLVTVVDTMDDAARKAAELAVRRAGRGRSGEGN